MRLAGRLEGANAWARLLTIASAQMGPIARAETRKDVVQRLLAMMREAQARGGDLVVFPELDADDVLSRAGS